MNSTLKFILLSVLMISVFIFTFLKSPEDFSSSCFIQELTDYSIKKYILNLIFLLANIHFKKMHQPNPPEKKSI